jgi:hypothetical protein
LPKEAFGEVSAEKINGERAKKRKTKKETCLAVDGQGKKFYVTDNLKILCHCL